MKIDIDFSLVSENEFPTIEYGWYKAVITEVGAVKTKQAQLNGTDDYYLNIKFKIMDGEYAGRVLWFRPNVKNENEKAQGMGRRYMKKILRIVGKEDATDYDEIQNIPLQIEIVTKPSYRNNNSLDNEIKDFAGINEVPREFVSTAIQSPSHNIHPLDIEILNDDLPF